MLDSSEDNSVSALLVGRATNSDVVYIDGHDADNGAI